MKGKNPIACTNEASCVTFNDFAGNSNDNYSKVCYGYDKGSWIIDTGASAHRCNSLDLFDKTSRIFFKNTVILPDRTNKSVAHIGIVILSPSLSLTEVLYMPSFKYNLLSVSKPSQTINLAVQFSSHACVLYQVTNEVVATRNLIGGLY